MWYKVFLVEDEIVIREGIRDHVDWKAHGFEFCGEAPDGEMALPLLQTNPTRCLDYGHQDAVYGWSAAQPDRSRPHARDQDHHSQRPRRVRICPESDQAGRVRVPSETRLRAGPAQRPAKGRLRTGAGKRPTTSSAEAARSGRREPGRSQGEVSAQAGHRGGLFGGGDREKPIVGHRSCRPVLSRRRHQGRTL